MSSQLSEANLEEHDRLMEWGTSEVMDFEVGTSEGGGRKRPWSQPPISTDMNLETASSERSSLRSQVSPTAAHYRFSILSEARIFIRPGPPSEEIQSRINTVIQRGISEERKDQMFNLAENLCKSFILIFDEASEEDDWAELIHRALSTMDSSRKLKFPRQADWDPSLKPSVLRNTWGTSFLKKSDNQLDGSITQPSKQPEADIFYLSLDGLPATLPPSSPSPPLTLPNQNVFLVKTPRPNITAGLHHSTMVEELVAWGVDKVTASDFLEDLQEQQILCSDPTQAARTIRFPVMVVEGKAYATGRLIFDAQNQAAVSGSCMTKLQQELADLTKNASHGSYDSKAPLAFSICTEGPYMELWVHYTTMEDNIHTYNMNILKTCHASLQEGVAEFFMVVDSIMSWAREDFVKDMAEQLVLVESFGRA